MSIYRQLWLAVIGLTLLTFVGSFVVSLYTARAYLQQQLYLKNVDNAAALGLVLSQLPVKDAVTVELLISSQFDNGHYQQILLTGTRHETLLERRYTGGESGVPAWFTRLFPIEAKAGIAQVQDGWRQFGTLYVVSHSRFAYQELWGGALRLAGWFLLAAMAAGGVGTWVLRRLFRPLADVVAQAQAISARRFITVAEPHVPELRAVVTAMNAMVGRLKALFAEEAGRLEALRRQNNHDALTDLANRAFFMTALREGMNSERAARGGTVAIVRIVDLDGLNTRLGHPQTDRLIKAIGLALAKLAGWRENCLAARLNGSDFALLVTGDDAAAAIADKIGETLKREVNEEWSQLSDLFHIGAVAYAHGENAGKIMAVADQALANAENSGPNAAASLDLNALGMSQDSWRQTLLGALAADRVRLAHYPARSAAGTLLHLENALRLQTEPGGSWLNAGEFLPMARRLRLATTLDRHALRLALEQLGENTPEQAINLSAESIADWSFLADLQNLLEANPSRRRKLWLEVPEYGAFGNFDAFKGFCQRFAPLGCKLGIEHFGQRFGEIAKLAELGLDYIKIDSRYVHAIDQNPGNREFLKGLCKMAQTVGIQVIAEGVMNEGELATLWELGFDGATGQVVALGV